MNFQEFLKLQEDACTTASVGNTPGVDSGFGKNPPKDKKMAKRKPLPEENELEEGIGVKRANPGQQQGHTAGARRGNTPMHNEPPAKMSKGALDILKKHLSPDELEDHQLHPDDKAELENHFKGQKTMKHESYKIGDRVEILRDGYRFGKVTGINEEDGSLYIDPNSPLSATRVLPILNLGVSEVQPFVNLRESLVSLKASIIQEAKAEDKKDDDDKDDSDDDKDDDKDDSDDKDDDEVEVDEDTKLILADLSLLKEANESSIRMVAVKYSAMSDLTIQEAIEKVSAIFEDYKDALDEAYDWTPEKLKELHGKDKKKWSALKVNRPDLKDKMGEVEAAHKSASKPAPKVEVDHFKVARVIDDSIGHAYPDGDPIDHIHPKMKAMGIKDEHILKHLDTAAKKHLGAKGYHDHVANAWDQYNSDTGSKDKNPWH